MLPFLQQCVPDPSHDGLQTGVPVHVACGVPEACRALRIFFGPQFSLSCRRIAAHSVSLDAALSVELDLNHVVTSGFHRIVQGFGVLIAPGALVLGGVRRGRSTEFQHLV